MRSFLFIVARALALTTVICALAGAWMTAMPGHPVPSVETPPSQALTKSLQSHVVAIAGERNALSHANALDRTAAYIESQLTNMGHTVQSQWFDVNGIRVRNLVAVISGSGKGNVVVVGAHYDSARFTPGADDNASGVAALLELARSAKSAQQGPADLHLVFFTNEEPPWFRTQSMGSYQYAASLFNAKRQVNAMLSLEMLGFYCSAPGCQKYPGPLSLAFPDHGEFIAFVGNLTSRTLVRKVTGTFRTHAGIASEGIAAPSWIPGVDYSDQQWFWYFDWPAVMVTDTSFMRNPHYHKESDRPDTLDYRRMAAVVEGLQKVIVALRAEP